MVEVGTAGVGRVLVGVGCGGGGEWRGQARFVPPSDHADLFFSGQMIHHPLYTPRMQMPLDVEYYSTVLEKVVGTMLVDGLVGPLFVRDTV